jgi:hypothetical protein
VKIANAIAGADVERDRDGALVSWLEGADSGSPLTLKVASLGSSSSGPTLSTVQTLGEATTGLSLRGIGLAPSGAGAIVRTRPAAAGRTIEAWTRSSRGRSFTGPFTIATTNADSGDSFAVDRFGSVAAVWLDKGAPVDRLLLGGLDVAAPSVSSLQIPARVRVRRSSPFSVRCSDPSGIRSVRWSFGDRGSASGSSVRHAFRRTGRYRVTVVVTDRAGLQSRASRRVAVVG